jgi:hypothetical protein
LYRRPIEPRRISGSLLSVWIRRTYIGAARPNGTCGSKALLSATGGVKSDADDREHDDEHRDGSDYFHGYNSLIRSMRRSIRRCKTTIPLEVGNLFLFESHSPIERRPAVRSNRRVSSGAARPDEKW